ncbi:rRNA methyltransferase [Rummeliibacillus sp. TYF005]|uniref:rRNA methyltransferase n=1 Tax=Rummeliibacillus sp. TYF005 TaxID=2058214 RepID=UPI000F523633|nr:rRNA methyltransferase [Rummeliibacillus sp. TYF005]RPJ96393.1 rRNA methyltransferase [Rummeliibacillus sp. TYF005]
MWKNINGKLYQSIDTARVKFRTNISKSLLNQLDKIAVENDTHVNYLLESGLKNLIELDTITFDKKCRPKDRVQYKTTYDSELLEQIKIFAKKHHLFINDVIEYSVKYIDLEEVKKSRHRFRIE